MKLQLLLWIRQLLNHTYVNKMIWNMYCTCRKKRTGQPQFLKTSFIKYESTGYLVNNINYPHKQTLVFNFTKMEVCLYDTSCHGYCNYSAYMKKKIMLSTYHISYITDTEYTYFMALGKLYRIQSCHFILVSGT
jgi:hypothetical protein